MIIDSIKDQIGDYPYALIYTYSDLALKDTADFGDIVWDECIEARFFGNGSELRLWKDRDGYKTAVYKGEGEYQDVAYKLDERFVSVRNTVIVRKYLDYDEDGQIYVKGSMLVGFER